MRIHHLVSVRVANILSILTDMLTPWISEAPACFDNQVSVLHFDEYIQLLAKPGVHHRKGIQCPFGARSSKSTSWVYFKVGLHDMPSLCPHPMRRWYCDNDRHRRTNARRPPTTGTSNYSMVPFEPASTPPTVTTDQPIKKRLVAGQLSA